MNRGQNRGKNIRLIHSFEHWLCNISFKSVAKIFLGLFLLATIGYQMRADFDGVPAFKWGTSRFCHETFIFWDPAPMLSRRWPSTITVDCVSEKMLHITTCPSLWAIIYLKMKSAWNLFAAGASVNWIQGYCVPSSLGRGIICTNEELPSAGNALPPTHKIAKPCDVWWVMEHAIKPRAGN